MYVFDSDVNLYACAKTSGITTSVVVPADGKYFIIVNDSKQVYMPITVFPDKISYTQGIIK